MSIEKLVAESAIRDNIARYCQTCDDGRFDEFADCFAVDAVMVVPGMATTDGRDAIREWIAKAMPADKRGKHVAFNTIIEVDGDIARAWTDYLFLNTANQVTTAGRYTDQLVRDGDRWLFQRREISFLGR